MPIFMSSPKQTEQFPGHKYLNNHNHGPYVKMAQVDNKDKTPDHPDS